MFLVSTNSGLSEIVADGIRELLVTVVTPLSSPLKQNNQDINGLTPIRTLFGQRSKVAVKQGMTSSFCSLEVEKIHHSSAYGRRIDKRK